MLCGNRVETINHLSVYRKLARKEYKARHDWVGKVIHWEMCKKLLWDFDVQMNHLISARRPDLLIIK